MKKILLPLFSSLVLVWMVLLSGCSLDCVDGQGKIVSYTRHPDSFTEIELNINADVEIGIALKTVMQIHAQPNVMKAITTKVSGGKLIIDASPCLGNTEPIQIKIFTPELTKIAVNGSGMVKTMNPVYVGDIDLEVSGSGKLFADVHSNETNVDISGSGEVIINGSSNSQNIKISGSGNYMGLGLRTNESSIEITGSGKAEVSTLNMLKVDISGSGEVVYAGTPKIKSEISGSGKLTKMD